MIDDNIAERGPYEKETLQKMVVLGNPWSRFRRNYWLCVWRSGEFRGYGIGSGSGTEDSGESRNNTTTEKSYQKVDLQTMLDELHENALRAESKHQNAYVEITGKISNFDSDGSYITVEAIAADEWNFDTVMCYIKNDTQKSFIMEKSVGDQVTIKGKITSIGELLGYSLNIEAIS